MYYVNKIVGAFLNPLGIGLLLMALAVWLAHLRKRRPAMPASLVPVCGLLSIAWLWFWSTGVVCCWIGLSLEREYPPQFAEDLPEADAIVVLGGGINLDTNVCLYAELFPAADRSWHGARLYRAGKAPRVFVTSEADARFMVDLGVPREVITVNDTARNTEEEARGLVEVLGQSRTAAKPKVLLVTSAWHMRRAKLMYERYAKGVEVVPAPTDHMTMSMFGRELEFRDFIPDPTMIGQNAYLFKEILAYYGYRLLRK